MPEFAVIGTLDLQAWRGVSNVVVDVERQVRARSAYVFIVLSRLYFVYFKPRNILRTA